MDRIIRGYFVEQGPTKEGCHPSLSLLVDILWFRITLGRKTEFGWWEKVRRVKGRPSTGKGIVGHTHARAATPPGQPEAVNATARIPIASGSLYHDTGRKQGGEGRVSGMEIAKVWDWCGNQEDRGKMWRFLSPKDLLCTRILDLYS
jgi:hypothetical protein